MTNLYIVELYQCNEVGNANEMVGYECFVDKDKAMDYARTHTRGGFGWQDCHVTEVISDGLGCYKKTVICFTADKSLKMQGIKVECV